MKVFISYHRADTAEKDNIVELLEKNNISYYSVPEDRRFDGCNHQEIVTSIGAELNKCDVLLCIVGQNTFSRPHVDIEIHSALKGGIGVRKGIVAVMLENRGDNKNNIDYNTFSTKLAENKDYIVLEQYASIHDRLLPAIKQAQENSKNSKLQTSHKNPVMRLRYSKYFDDN